jgi:peptide/nickel transport system permease protein
LLYGGQRTLLMTGVAVAVAVTGGASAGIMAGFLDGYIDDVITTLTSAMLAIPGLMIALVILTMTGQGILQVALATGMVQVAPMTLVIRSQAKLLRQADYITGALAIGASNWRVLICYILPGCLPLILSYGSVIFGYCLLNIGSLGFLGLMGEPGIPEWGVMLAEGREVLREAPWVGAAPGIAISLIVLGVNWLADRIIQRESQYG